MMKKIISIAAAMCILMSIFTVSAASDACIINVDEPALSYTESAGVRTAKIVNISGSLSHGLSDRVAAILKDSSGDIKDTTQTYSQEDGRFTLSFVLPKDLTKGECTVTVGSANCEEAVTKTLNLSPMGTKSSLIAFSVDGKAASVSGSQVSLNMSSYTNLMETVPVFSASDGAAVYIGSNVQTSGVSKVNFANGSVVYRVVSEDLKSETSYTVTVKNPSDDGGKGSKGSSSGKGSSFDIGSTPAVQPEAIFNDLYGYEWAEEYIISLYNAKIISGDGTGRFYPANNVTREEYVKMIVLAFGLSGDDEIHFEDISAGHWAYPYIRTGYASGVINGVSHDRFGAGSAITRQDMAVIAYRAAMLTGKLREPEQTSIVFADEDDISAYASDAVDYMSACGIINGTGNNNFSPLKTASRSEAAKIICLMTE